MTYEEEQELLASGIHIIGADEVGRGALAGPIVAASCLINQAFLDMWKSSVATAQTRNEKIIIRDSKKMTKNQLRISATWLVQNIPAYTITSVKPHVIDSYGIQTANREVLKKALFSVSQKFNKLKTSNTPACDDATQPHKKQASELRIFIDHFPLRQIDEIPVEPITKGEQYSIAIAAASIIAKVHRDRLMEAYAQEHDEYGWDTNVGYGSAQHRDAIKKHGPSPYHRMSFLGKILEEAKGDQLSAR